MTTLFKRLQNSCSTEWHAYTQHEFVRALNQGTLSESSFQHYLMQDYLFLIQLSRAYAICVYKSDKLSEMRQASQLVNNILDKEMKLHLRYCNEWGISSEVLEETQEATATVAYTRFFLEIGMSGDLLDLHVALAPCVIGYGVIGDALINKPTIELSHNPFRHWIEEYGGWNYQQLAATACSQLDSLSAKRGGEERLPALVEIFRQATKLEAQFWQMGLDQSY